MAKTKMLILTILAINILVSTAVNGNGQVDQDGPKKGQRRGKLFPIFQVMTFKNEACTATGTNNGTCYTATECSNKGGTNSGECASGFGVCCVFTPGCGESAAENNTYLDSTSSASTVSGIQCVYEICKCNDDICRIRLDFETFNIAQPHTFTVLDTAVDTEGSAAGDCLTDSMSVTAPGKTSSPVICGYNTGQHMILDASDGCHKVNFDIASQSTTSSWNIKVTQYTCGDLNGGPPGCLQYFQGTTGLIKTYNYPAGLNTVAVTDQHLSNQRYDICFRRETGRCSICFTEATTSSFAVSIGGIAASASSLAGTNCISDYIEVPGVYNSGTTAPQSPRLCGMALSVAAISTATSVTVCSQSTPFKLSFTTDADEITSGATFMADDHENAVVPQGGHLGFALYYIQGSC